MKDPRFAEHLAVFVDVVRHGSFSAAARRRGQTPSAVVRQIDTLEQSLGVTLLVRSTRALGLTDAGERLMERAQPLLDQLADAHAEVAAFDGAVAGTLRLACFPTFGKRYVIPALTKMMRAHPHLRIELDLTERLADPVLDRLDAVIRIGQLADSGLFATRLADQRRLLVASQDYLTDMGMPDSVEALTQHRLIEKLHGADLLGWADILGRRIGDGSSTHSVFRCDDFEAMRLAAVGGMGVALLPDWVVGSDVNDGSLIRIPLEEEAWNATPTGVWLLRALAQPSARLRAATAAIKEIIGNPPIWT
ncbi:LysR family transcriptional regulator [Acetobacter nitrogenifigens DSM 23921 = NBRC 105050]|uniref:Transcriptional regulator n=2 Tax=Acetobacter nitrogenifigens TaxID=285268 RepID=A0A511XBB9_9PROT|nr:LysR family transcriptional regulator [Acetobacter nitrogenifigens]GBQ90742.1 LysR family transcriptional regulator [Acetobacter nitrogenifigens DSM 23921 = NBRC 105050]GEN60269.1 transcriptional regulator [Acetobacter nitrogenifigens DSM 23921 = NBRC 105050]